MSGGWQMADAAKATKPGWIGRLFPPPTPEQMAVLAQVKLPCC